MPEDENHQDESDESTESPSEDPETPPEFQIERHKEDFAGKSRVDLEDPSEEADEE